MDTDFLLIMKMKQGKEEAFEIFVRKYYEDILTYCNYHCFDVEYAKDLTQETFLRFFNGLSEYHYRRKTKNYLYTIAANLCKNFYQKKKDIPMEGQELEMVYPIGIDPLDRTLERIMVETALDQLPADLREVVILYYFQGLKLLEIAGVLEISLSLVKYRMAQARKQLKQFLGDDRKEGIYESKKGNGNIQKTKQGQCQGGMDSGHGL